MPISIAALTTAERVDRPNCGATCVFDPLIDDRPWPIVSPDPLHHTSNMFVVSESEAAAIRTAFEQPGELSAAIELRRLFPGSTDNTQTRKCARPTTGWKPLPPRPPGGFGTGSLQWSHQIPDIRSTLLAVPARHAVPRFRPLLSVSPCDQLSSGFSPPGLS